MNKKSKYFIFTLGCQMNISDSERIATKLEESGYESAPEKEADLVIVNACSVRQSAVDRIWGKIKKWQGEDKKIFLTGCILSTDRKKFEEKDIHFFDIKNLTHLGKILNKHSNILQNVGMSVKETSIKDYFSIIPKGKTNIAYIPIMTGCDNFCSYCAVPYTRGREISRPMNNITSEVIRVIKNGSKDILLLGQNVNSYRIVQNSNLKNQNDNVKLKIYNKDFIQLLKTIDKLPWDFNFNFISSNPHDMSDKLIKTFVWLKKWPRELHLPMQSGDDEILHKMKRKYTASRYLSLISKLKSQISNLLLSTDIIVGFPGETKEQFNNTVKICKKIGFSKAYIAQYSPRPGTAAAKLKDDVLAKEKKRRWKILDRIINQTKYH